MDYVRGLLIRSKSGFSTRSDVEKASPAESTTRRQLPEEELPTIISPTERLITFRLLVGITTDKSLHTSIFSSASRPAINVGIYTRIVKNEQASGRKYTIFSLLINFCLALQLIVAAALTALGASGTSSNNTNGQQTNHHSTSVTALGAINTVIAGFLTYLKGSGLPGRHRYYESEWRKLRELIEQREREMSRPDCTLDVYNTVAAIEDLYDDTRQDVESSVPDAYHSAAASRRDRTPSADIMAHLRGLPASARGTMTSTTDALKNAGSRYGSQVQHLAEDVTHRAKETGRTSETLSTLKEVEADLEQTTGEVRDAAEEVHGFAQRRFGRTEETGSAKADPGHH